MAFDPEAPLPGAPDPWRPSTMPERRDAPPYNMTEMIAAEPALAERLARRTATSTDLDGLTQEIREAGEAHRSVIVTGCGTSHHAAMAAATMLAGTADVRAVEAFELLRRPIGGAPVVAISHEGGTWATTQALEAARAAGATTALITVSDRSPGAALADILITTEEQDQSWCHTVGYLSPLVVAAALRSRLGGDTLDITSLRALLQGADAVAATEATAAALARCDRVLIAGSGIDAVSARELALKIEEGARLPAVARELEEVRHGHLAAAGARTGFILFLTDTDAADPLLPDRARAVLRSASALGMPAAGILAADIGDDIPLALTPAGRLPVPLAGALPRVVNGAIGAAIPLQLLAERLARARGVNPDTLAREDPRQVAAAEA